MMKKIAVATAFSSVLVLAACQPEQAMESAPKADTSSEEGKVAYSLGYNIGKSLMNDFENLDLSTMQAGVAAAYAKQDPVISEADMEAVLQAQQEKIMEERQQKRVQDMEAAQAESQKLLDENSKKEGVTVTESGLQYEVLTQGEGPQPTADDTVTVHYHGMLPNGEVFDSSVDRGSPATFPLKGVIRGWTEGVPLMKVGSKYKFTIPADLAYGERGAPPKIGPNQVLIFDVELLEIEGQEQADTNEVEAAVDAAKASAEATVDTAKEEVEAAVDAATDKLEGAVDALK